MITILQYGSETAIRVREDYFEEFIKNHLKEEETIVWKDGYAIIVPAYITSF